MSSQTESLREEPQVLRIFISYASEDVVIATALARVLRDALGDVAFAEINIDQWFLEAGTEFRQQIESTLEKTDVFISLYTGLNKQWPAWEVGFFAHVMKSSPKQRELVPIFLNTAMAPATSTYEGIELHVPAEHLRRSADEFAAAVQKVDDGDPLCKFLARMQAVVDDYREAGGFHRAQRTEQNDARYCVRNLKLQIFNYLKTTVEETIRPQKQLLIRTTGAALERADVDLPAEALLVPIGQGNSMSAIFGLSDAPRTWKAFIEETSTNEHAESWRASIVSVISSSFPSRIDVDNSQIVVSNDNAKTYRVILSSTIKYYDDKRELNLYFVESLRRSDFGDEETTLLLRALELCCRFRFMFFEQSSPFSELSIRLTPVAALPVLATQILRELSLLRKDARDVGLDHVSKWLKLVDPGQLVSVLEIYQGHATNLTSLTGRILESKNSRELLQQLQSELAAVLSEMRVAVEGGNLSIIQQMTERLRAATQEHS